MGKFSWIVPGRAAAVFCFLTIFLWHDFSFAQRNNSSDSIIDLKLDPGLLLQVSVNTIIISAAESNVVKCELLKDPPRYVIDIPGHKLDKPLFHTLLANPNFTKIRAATHDAYLRIVFDLTSEPPVQPAPVNLPGKIKISFVMGAPQQTQTAVLATPNIVDISPKKELTLSPEASSKYQTIIPSASPTATLTFTVTSSPTLSPVPSAEPTVSPTPTNSSTQTPITVSSLTTENNETYTPTPVTTDNLNNNVSVGLSAEEKETVERVELRFSLSDLIISFPFNARPIHDVTVKNRSNSQLFMTAIAEQVINPGMPDERKEFTKALLVSPRRFELAPGEERLVRVVVAERTPEEERVFRVNFIPDAEAFKNISPEITSINAGLAALVLVRPKSPIAALNSEWSSVDLVLQNKGNTDILLDRIKACKGKTCRGLPTKRLYSNAVLKIPVDDITSVEFLQKIGDDFENVVLKRDNN